MFCTGAAFFENGCIKLLKSFCLFEMPLFFFVTGAGNGFGEEEKYFRFVFRRYKRMLIPYWGFAIICAGLSIAYFGLKGGIDIFTAAKVLASWLIPIDRQITSVPYLTWALWFVPVYLCIVLLIPLLKRIRQARYATPYFAAMVVLF